MKLRRPPQALKLPAHTIYNHWLFRDPVDVMEWEITIDSDPGETVGQYLALFDGSIDGAHCYLGLQTDVYHPELGRGIGKGLIFSTWWSFDPADTRLAADGFRQLGTHEGRFVGVRKPYPWTAGSYRVTLERAHPSEGFDWFDLYITSVERGLKDYVGGLRFPRGAADRPARIQPSSLSFMEVYSFAHTWAEVPGWELDVMAYGDGARCPRGRIEYPAYPHGQYAPNVNARFDTAPGRVHMSTGPGVSRVDRAGDW